MTEEYDAIVIGAGVSGLFQLYRLRQLGMSVRVYEAGDNVGGTWYWNRYPGARFDSESYSYGYSFSQELLDEWEWTEHFAAQPETLRYLNFVADKFDLRKDIACNTRVRAARFDSAASQWEVELEDGARARARFLVAAVGALSAPTMPDIPGIDDFRGQSFHTARWPHEPVDLAGKRVAVIGTGATGVQVIQEVAKAAAQLVVFQRTPNWCAPLRNRPITPEEQRAIHEGYAAMFARCDETFGSFIHGAADKKAMEVPEEEREAFYERLYAEPGFGIWMANYRDVLVDEAANATLSNFIAKKIRERVTDPAVAEKLIPKDHGFGTRRVPLETNYYEVYNQPNVQLIDVRETPIERITPTGIQTSAASFDVDLIIYATGFAAVTGTFERIAFVGEGGLTLRDKWADGPKTYLGMQFAGFPNLFAVVGPHNAAAFCNMPRCIEHNVEWIANLLRFMREPGYTRVVPAPEAEDAWTKHVHDLAGFFLLSNVNSWFTGVNQNIAERRERSVMLYTGGAPAYRKQCDEVAAKGYEGFQFS